MRMAPTNPETTNSPRTEEIRKPTEVVVLRLGHRLVRDARMSTHIGLVSRAFGATSLVISGADDETVDSIRKVNKNWGGGFEVVFAKNWREMIRQWEGKIVHLTMYGEHIDEVMPRIKAALKGEKISTKRKILVIVGAEKVPGEIYRLSDFNVAIGNQPHSEIAALAVFLDRLFMGGELYYSFENARIKILPKAKGKEVETLTD